MRVAIAYSAQRDTPDTDLTSAVDALDAALQALGYVPLRVPLGMDVPAFLQALAAARPDVIWNLCEEAGGRSGLELHAAALLELHGAPVTGSRAAVLALCLDKSVCRHVLRGHGVAVPQAVRVQHSLPAEVPLPAIVKPACEDGSVGIDSGSVVQTRAQAVAAVQRLADRDLLPALIERFIDGRELNVLLLGQGGQAPARIAVGEIDFDALPAGQPRILTYAGKWDESSAAFQLTPSLYPAEVAADLRARLEAIGTAAWLALGLSGYARLDLRIDAAGRPVVIDVNADPDISPGAGLQRALPTIGWTFAQFVDQQLAWATRR